MRCLLLLFVGFLLLCVQTRSQSTPVVDSLQRLLTTAKEDSAHVLLLIRIGQETEGTSPELAKTYYLQAKQLSSKIGYQMGVLKFYPNYTAVLNIQGRFDSALILNKEALALAQRLNNEERIAVSWQNLANTYMYLEDFEQAIACNLKTIPYFEAQNNAANLSLVYANLGTLYRSLRRPQESLRYLKQSLQLARTIQSDLDEGYALAGLGVAYTDLQQFDSALQQLQPALAIARRTNYQPLVQAVLLDLSNVYLKQARYPLLQQYATEALQVGERLGDSASMQNALYGIALAHFHAGRFADAETVAQQGLAISTRQQNKHYLSQFYALLSKYYLVKGDLQRYDQYDRLSDAAANERLNDEIQKNIQTLEKKYETEKKNAEIRQLNQDRQIKSLWNYILGGSLIALLLTGLLGYRAYKQKQELQQQQISKLEKETQLLAAAAVLKGQEDERSRLAKDLHDGLGGMLSGIKHSFNTMKGNLILTPDNALAFERSMQLLDTSIRELRMVAHNLMPESLVKFGMDTALKDFCETITGSGALLVRYHSFGLESVTLDKNTEITVYRMVQELVNNSMKHAEATEAIVQLQVEDKQLTVTVEDNGKGFDSNVLNTAKGIGWSNIRNRVDYMKGTIHINSAPGKGTSIHIELPLDV